MKIYYLTTSLTSDQFESLLKNVKVSPNPSNQNFHHALITSIAHYELIEVVTTTPLNSEMLNIEEIKENDAYENLVHYHTLGFSNNKKKRKCIVRNLTKYLEENVNKDDIIFVDSMNLTLSHTANKFSKKHNNKVIGVLTDNPKYITGLSKVISTIMIREMKNFYGYISLTPSLLSLVNGKSKPHMIIEGIYENFNHNNRTVKNPYIFFAGSLNPKYGICNLIKAFSLLSYPCQLLIAGHGKIENELYQLINSDHSIRYLGTLSKKEITSYESSSLININPRPHISCLDEYSIPSKVIEYAGSGKPTISGEHARLKEIYGDSIYWCKADSVIEIYNAMSSILKSPKKAENKAKKAQKITNKKYGVDVVGKQIHDFIKNIPHD